MDPLRPIPTYGALRALRGVCVGAAAVCVAAVGHIAGGGALPALGVLAALAIPATGFAWWCSDRRWTGARLVAALLGVQGLLHLVFTTSDPHAHHGGGALMLLGHLVATVVTARLLSSGESWLWDLVGALALRVVGRVQVSAVPMLPRARPGGRPLLVLVSPHLRSTPRLRGPPLPVAVH